MSQPRTESQVARINVMLPILSAVVGVIAAIATSSVVGWQLYQDVQTLKGKVATMETALGKVSPTTTTDVLYNGRGPAHCDPGSFISGLTISVDGKLNSSGQIWCAKIQPAISQ
jgi:hypothetical protein